MEPRKLLSALAFLTLPLGVYAQCSFQTDKNQPGFEFIHQPVGSAGAEWKVAVGKNAGKYYLWANIVDKEAGKHTLNSNDRVFLDLVSGERLSFTPATDVVPQTTAKGNSYAVRFEIDKDIMEKISTTGIEKVAGSVGGREVAMVVKDEQASKLRQAATCVLK